MTVDDVPRRRARSGERRGDHGGRIRWLHDPHSVDTAEITGPIIAASVRPTVPLVAQPPTLAAHELSTT